MNEQKLIMDQIDQKINKYKNLGNEPFPQKDGFMRFGKH